MTDMQKEVIRKLRMQGLSNRMIAQRTGVSYEAIKSFCWRNSIVKNEEEPVRTPNDNCRECGVHVEQNPKRKHKDFCSDACRRAWWKKNRVYGNKKSAVQATCAFCGKVFYAYTSQNKKYCSHPCYIKDRFGGKTNGTMRVRPGTAISTFDDHRLPDALGRPTFGSRIQ